MSTVLVVQIAVKFRSDARLNGGQMVVKLTSSRLNVSGTSRGINV